MVWSAVSEVSVRRTAVVQTVGTSRTSERRVRRTSVVRAGLTESGNAVRRVSGTSVRRWSVESSTSVVRGTSVVYSCVRDARRARAPVGEATSVTIGAISGSFVRGATVSRSRVTTEATIRDVSIRKHSDVSRTVVGGTSVGSPRSSCE